MAKRLAPVPFIIIALLAAIAGGACNGDDQQPAADDDAAYDAYARSVCTAMSAVVDAVQPNVTPGAGPPTKAMTSAWEQFIKDLEKAEAPGSLEKWHADWVKMQKDDLAGFKAGTGKYFDPLDHAPEMSAELGQRLSAAYMRVPECKPRAEAPTGDSASPAPPPTRQAGSVDYSHPDKYAQPGPQSTLSTENAVVLKSEVGPGRGLSIAGSIAGWLTARFRTEPAGGATIGTTDVNTLIQTRKLTGCHDSALVFSTALRLYGVPALMVDTAAIQWAEDFRTGRTQSSVGHVFVEAHIDGRWVLIECGSGAYASDYDPSNPVITCPTMPDPKGYYAVAKGLDPADYGVTSGEVLNRKMTDFANRLPELSLRFPRYEWRPLPGK